MPYSLIKLFELEISPRPLRFPIKINNKEEFKSVLYDISQKNIYKVSADIVWDNEIRYPNKYPVYFVPYPSNSNFIQLRKTPYSQFGDILQAMKSLNKEQKAELRQFIKSKYNIQEDKTKMNEEETFYHGTSHYFKCFRTAGVGGGAGMQAFGWGLYFGKDVNLANSYAGIGTNSGKKMLLFQGKTPAELAFEYDCIIFERLPSGLSTVDEFIEYARDMIELLEEDGDNPELVSEYRRFIEIIENLEIKQEPMKYVYEVLLHKGKKPSEYEYLNWDHSVPQNQINKINNQAQKEHLNIKISGGSGSNVYHNIESYFESKGSKNAPKDASLFLLRSGIDGNTHSNGSVRIIFDEKAITIVNVCKKS